MNLAYSVMYFSILVWTFVPIRQYRQRLFWFFVFLATQDPITLIIRKILNSGSNLVFIIASILMIFSLIDYKHNFKRKIIFLSIFTLLCVGLILSGFHNIDVYIIILEDFAILVILLTKFADHLTKNHEIKTFFTLLILYQLNNITKELNLFSGFINAYSYFYITTAFEILIGLFFIIFKEDDPRINFIIKK